MSGVWVALDKRLRPHADPAWLVWKAGGDEGQREGWLCSEKRVRGSRSVVEQDHREEAESEVDAGAEVGAGVGAEEETVDERGVGEGVGGPTGSPCGLGKDQRKEVCGVLDAFLKNGKR